jgi:hypothetical protein
MSASGAGVEADDRREQHRPGQEEEARLLPQPLLHQPFHARLHGVHATIDARESELQLVFKLANVGAMNIHALHPCKEIASRLGPEGLLKLLWRFGETAIAGPCVRGPHIKRSNRASCHQMIATDIFPWPWRRTQVRHIRQSRLTRRLRRA